tara:strand:+ start:352 stop:1563 length:1212 start_codon:yes stop_codon:yes gene_type:complete
MKSYYLKLNNNISVANIWIDGGTSLDKKEKKGTNQILCSLLTRGCKTYDNYEFSDFLDSYGAELNFEAFEDGISICLKSLSEYFDKLFPLLDLIIEEPNLYEKEFNFCKKESLNNIIKSKENQFNITYNNLKIILYQEHPYSYNCIGDEESIKLIKHDDILNEYKSFKKRDKYLLTNSTNYSFLDLKSIEDSYYENKENKSQLKLFNNNNFIKHYSNSNQVIMMIGSQTCPHFYKDSLYLKILESYLSYGMSSLLFKVFREKNGLTYDSGVFYPSRKYNAPFLIYLSVSEKYASSTLNLLVSLWKNLVTKKISTDDLSLAKLKLRRSFLHNYRTCEDITFRKVRLLGLGMDPYHDEKIADHLGTADCDQILNVSKRYLTYPSISISGSKQVCNNLFDIWNKKY